MLNRLLGMLGYVPASSVSRVNDDPAHDATPVEPPLPPHREAAGAFDLNVAANDDLCFLYCDGDDTYSYAV